MTLLEFPVNSIMEMAVNQRSGFPKFTPVQLKILLPKHISEMHSMVPCTFHPYLPIVRMSSSFLKTLENILYSMSFHIIWGTPADNTLTHQYYADGNCPQNQSTGIEKSWQGVVYWGRSNHKHTEELPRLYS